MKKKRQGIVCEFTKQNRKSETDLNYIFFNFKVPLKGSPK